MTTPNQDPIPSNLPNNFRFNIEKTDEEVNSPLDYYTDRFGVRRLTNTGRNKQFQNKLLGMGWQEMGDFAVGILVESRSQVIFWNGSWYQYIGALPHTTTTNNPNTDGGVFSQANPSGNWVNLGADITLRQDLISDDTARADALIRVKQPFLNSVPRTQHDFNQQFISVLDAGAVGDGVTSDRIAVIRALSNEWRVGGYAFVKFNAGRTYFIDGNIILTAKTVIQIERGAIVKMSGSTAARFFNGIPGDANYATGHDGNGDIHFFGGGIIDCNGGSGAVGFAHARDITFTDITFRNAKNTHFLEINSSQNVTFTGCIFDGMQDTDGGLHEMLQFDSASQAGFPSFGAWDNTPCENVLVTNCVFRNGSHGVGSHANPVGGQHKTIRILNNGFYNMTVDGIRAQGWGLGSVCSNNLFYESGRTPFLAVGTCSEMEISNNTVLGGGDDSYGGFWFSVSGGVHTTNMHIFGNRAMYCKGEGFYFAGMNNSSIHNNEVHSVGKRGLYLHNGSSGNNIYENTVFNCGTLVANSYDAFYISASTACNGNRFYKNKARTLDAAATYRYAVVVRNDSNRVNDNDFQPGATGTILDEGVLTEINGETFLTGVMAVTSGTITLRDDISKYSEVSVFTGGAGAGSMSFDSRGWTTGFRPGTDYVNGRSLNGNVVMQITNGTTLTIVSAADSVRFIVGKGRTWY